MAEHPHNFASQKLHRHRLNKYHRHYPDNYDGTAAGLVETKPATFRNGEDWGTATPGVPNDAIVDVRNDGHSSYGYAERMNDDDSSLIWPASSRSPPLDQHLQQQRFFKGRPVKTKNQHLPDHVLEFKQRRKMRTAASAWTGAVVGFVSLGPVGAVVGGTAAYGIAKGVGKVRERKLMANSGLVDGMGSPHADESTGERSEGSTAGSSSSPPLLHNAVMA
jgi:hypothetical protein